MKNFAGSGSIGCQGINYGTINMESDNISTGKGGCENTGTQTNLSFQKPSPTSPSFIKSQTSPRPFPPLSPSFLLAIIYIMTSFMK